MVACSTAVLCGDVHVGPDSRVLFGAVLTAEDGRVEVGARCVIMENALVRAREAHPVTLGDDVLVGPHAHVNGSAVGDGCFLATGCCALPRRPGSAADVEVRINGVVHVNTVLEDDAMVPIGWVAVGKPARVIAPWDHDEIWRIQEALDFPADRLRPDARRARARADGAPGRVVRRPPRRP